MTMCECRIVGNGEIMKKRFIAFIVAAVLCVVSASCAKKPADTADNNTASTVGTDEFKLEKAQTYTEFENGRNVICCFGDSLTYGWGSTDGYNYPDQLQGNLKGQYKVYNGGVCGEKADAVRSRANGCDFELTNDLYFAAGVDRIDLDRELFTVTGAVTPIQYLGFGKDLPPNKIIIDGTVYDIEHTPGAEYQHDTYTIVRKNTDSALTIKKGTQVKYDYSDSFDKCDVAIINFGANDGDSGSDELLEKYKEFAARYEKYLIFVPMGTDETEQKFTDAFGEHAVVLRPYFLGEAMDKYVGDNVTDAVKKYNEYCFRHNIVPASFRLNQDRNEVHFNALGNKVIADKIYERGVQLGYWK